MMAHSHIRRRQRQGLNFKVLKITLAAFMIRTVAQGQVPRSFIAVAKEEVRTFFNKRKRHTP